MFSGDAALGVLAEHALAGGRRVAVRDDRRPAELLERHAALLRERVLRVREDDELVRGEDDRLQALLRGNERHDAEVERRAEDLDPEEARGRALHVELDAGVRVAKARDERNEDLDAGLVRADHDPAALHVLQVLDGPLGLLGHVQDALGVVLQRAPRFREAGLARRAVEEGFAENRLEAAHGLAHRGLRAEEPHGRAGEAALLGDREEDAEGGDIHKICLILAAEKLV